MGTSSFSDWTAEARLYSGRPNPRWTVRPREAAELVALWYQLPVVSDPAAAVTPRLGYRGCVLHAPDGRSWVASGGLTTLTPAPPVRDAVVFRDDAGHHFERRLPATAPPGTLPPTGPGR